MLLDIVANGGLDMSKRDDVLKLAATLFGFFFLLRSGEYLRTEHGINADKCVKMKHVTFYRNGTVIDGAGNETARPPSRTRVTRCAWLRFVTGCDG